MANSAAPIANFAEYKDDLFRLYKQGRYNEVICNSLMRRAVNVDKWVSRSVLGLVAISLLTGSTSYLNPPILSPLWAVLNALATLLAVYSLVVSSSRKQSHWFNLSSKFLALAETVEFFSGYVRTGKVTDADFREQWVGFRDQLNDLLQRGDVELREYTEKNEKWLTERLEEILEREGKLRGLSPDGRLPAQENKPPASTPSPEKAGNNPRQPT